MDETPRSTAGRRVGLAICAAAALVCGASAMSPETVEATVNGLRITVDAQSGRILKLAFPGPGTMLESGPERAGVIDLAYPIKEFEPLRLASQYSTGADVKVEGGGLVIHWSRLGLSRGNYQIAGNVEATVRFTPHPDGKSVVMSAEVVNHSDNHVRQVLFPDFPGLLPFGGEELYNFEIDAPVLDYTWNWLGYIDCRPLTSVFPAPRVNCGVSSSPLVAKKAFADNLYLNVMPRKPESINGTDWIASRPR